jgi:hypothetical protein
MTAAGHKDALRVTDIFFTPELPEYPASSETGIAYVVDVTFMNDDQRSLVEDGVCVLNMLPTGH